MIKITDHTKKNHNTEPDISSDMYKIILSDAKMTLVARKLDDEELYASRNKSNNLLSKIHEETYGDIDDGYSKTLDNFEINQEGIKNIFQDELLANSKYKEHNRGPMFAKDGHVVKHSVVGPSDLFDKMNKSKRLITKESDNSEKMSYLGVGDGTPNTLVHGQLKVRPQSTKSNFHHEQVSNLSFAVGDSKLIGFGQKKAERQKNDLNIKKEDLLDHIDKLREAQDQFYREEQAKLQKLPQADRLFLTKDTRIIENYERKLNEWDRITEVVNKKVGREPGFSITTKGEAFRRKKEQAAILDTVLPDHERYGKHYWNMTLRKPFPKLRLTKDGKEIPEDFETTLFRDKKEKLEILAKPRPYTRDTSRTVTGKTEREYLSSRMTQREKLIDKVNPANPDVIKEFVVEGCNKLNTEVDAFFKQAGKKEIISVPKNFFEKKDPTQNVDIVIEKNYERQEILRNGLTTVVKMK